MIQPAVVNTAHSATKALKSGINSPLPKTSLGIPKNTTQGGVSFEKSIQNFANSFSSLQQSSQQFANKLPPQFRKLIEFQSKASLVGIQFEVTTRLADSVTNNLRKLEQL